MDSWKIEQEKQRVRIIEIIPLWKLGENDPEGYYQNWHLLALVIHRLLRDVYGSVSYQDGCLSLGSDQVVEWTAKSDATERFLLEYFHVSRADKEIYNTLRNDLAALARHGGE